MDSVDIAALNTDVYIQEQIRNSKVKAGKKLHPIGKCHYCEEKLSGNQLFCDPDCRDDYEIYCK